MVAGSFGMICGGEFGIILGDLLASNLRVKLGDKVTLILPGSCVSPAGVTATQRFEVKAFKVGAQLDSSMASGTSGGWR